MTPLHSAALAGLGAIAGLLGALTGVGGGILIVPALSLLFGVELRQAIAASLVAVVATSSAAGSVYVGAGTVNLRLGMLLEVATTLGGVSGGLLAARVPTALLGGGFAVLMAVTAVLLLLQKGEARAGAAQGAPPMGPADAAVGWEERGALAGAFVDERGALVRYRAVRTPLGLGVSFVAGVASGLLGVGGGFLKVPAMAVGMSVPFKVAAATSNFMIGVTAGASLFIYFARGDVVPAIAAPVAVGVAAGALLGTLVARRVPTAVLRWILAVALVGVAVEMLARAAGVRHG